MDSDELKKKKARYVALTRKADAHEKMSDAENTELASLENLRQRTKKPEKSSGNIFTATRKKIMSLLKQKKADSKDKKKKPTAKEHKAGLGGIGKYVKAGGKY